MDWLLKRQDAIERRLAKRHLEDGALVLYDLTSVWLEGRRCPLGRRGYSREAGGVIRIRKTDRVGLKA